MNYDELHTLLVSVTESALSDAEAAISSAIDELAEAHPELKDKLDEIPVSLLMEARVGTSDIREQVTEALNAAGFVE